MIKSPAPSRSRSKPTEPFGPPRSGTSRPALWRVMEIHKMVRAGYFPNCTTLAQVIEVTPKTIQRDVSFMREQLGMPLAYHELEHGFYYTRDVNEFPLLQLTRHDVVALFLAKQALEPMRGTRLERMLAASFSKIAEACPGEVSIQWQDLDEMFTVKAAGVLSADVPLFSALLDAAMARREVSFDYLKLTATEPESRTVQPYHVGQIEHGWYLLAYDPQRKGMRTFALQRMTNLTVLKTKFTRDPKFSARDHLGGGFGVWNHDAEATGRKEVCIHFYDYAARVVAERKWHASQVIKPLKEDGSAIEFRAKLTGLEEITRWVLSWGSKAKVLGPPELKKRVRAELVKMAALNG